MKKKKSLADVLSEMGIEGETFTIDMTGGGKPYEDWNAREKRSASRALIVQHHSSFTQWPTYSMWRINERKLPKNHPYRGLNENGQRHAATSLYIESMKRVEKASRKSNLVFG